MKAIQALRCARTSCVVLLLLFSLNTAAAQEAGQRGTVIGTITDVASGESLPGATVRVQATALGAATDLSGQFRLVNVPAGEQVIVVSYIGYVQQERTVTVEAGQPVRLDVALALDILQGDEITITGQAEGQVAAINQQLSSNQIVNVVSAARIQELPDANAAESVGRLPGISIQRDAGEGQKVVIRGLSPRYNAVTVNGVALPGTDFEDRSTDLNMVSSDMLASIEVFKALSADQDADAIGGTVNFRLRGAPRGPRVNVVMQGGYSGLSESLGNYKGNLTLSNRFLDNRLGVFLQGNLERADRSSERVSADYRNDQRSTADTSRVLRVENILAWDREETRDRLGASLMLDYELPFGMVQLTNFFNRLDRQSISRDHLYSVAVNSVSYDLRETHSTTDVLSSALSGEFDLAGRATLDFNLNRSSSLLSRPYDSRMRFTQANAYDAANLVRDEGPEVVPQYVNRAVENTYFDRADLFSQEMRERDLGGLANLTVPYQAGNGLAGHVKTGFRYRFKTRSNENRQDYLPLFFGGANGGLDELIELFPDAERSSAGRIGIASFLDPDYPTESILNGTFDFFYTPRLDMMRRAQEGLRSAMFRGAWAGLQDFEAEEQIVAGYVLTELNLGQRIMLLPGVRYEHTRTSYDAFFGTVPSSTTTEEDQQFVLRDTTSQQSFGNWFPMVQARVRPTDWFDVRMAYTRTQSRPDFRYTSPQVRINDNAMLITKGTPDLRPAQAQNVDLYFSFYNNRIGLFSIGGYYKRIDDVVYEARIRLQDQETADAFGFGEYVGFEVQAPLNLGSPTHVRGVEFDWQATLFWLPSPFNGLIVNANYSRIFSSTRLQRLRATTTAEPPIFLPVTTYTTYFREVQMLDQPDHVANVALGYDRGGFSGRISMLYQEGNVTAYGSNEGNIALFDTYVRWDAQVGYTIRPGLNVYAQLNNITNTPDTSLQGSDRLLSRQEVYGTTINVGVRYRPFL